MIMIIMIIIIRIGSDPGYGEYRNAVQCKYRQAGPLKRVRDDRHSSATLKCSELPLNARAAPDAMSAGWWCHRAVPLDREENSLSFLQGRLLVREI